MPRFVRGALLRAYVEAAKAEGLEPYRMMRKAGLPREALDQPDVPIPAEKVQILLQDSEATAESTVFGLTVGCAVTLPMMGALGLLMREQSTLRGAVEALAKYANHQNNTVFVSLRRTDGGVALQASLLDSRFWSDRRLVDLAVATEVSLLRGVMGPQWRPALVSFALPRPPDVTPYEERLGPVAFDQVFNGVIISQSDLDRPIPGANPDVARELVRFLERSLVSQGHGLSDRVNELIARLLPRGDCSIDKVSEYLGVDRRTIHRRLAQEGATFTELVDHTRREMVATDFARGDQPLSVIAKRLGFSSPSTFSRWFRQAYGVPASQFRGASRR